LTLFPTFPPDIAWADEAFDGMMVCRAAVYKSGATGQVDAYRQPISTYQMLREDVPCFVKSLGGKELNVPPAPASETSYGIATHLVFMRPIQVDSPPVDLNIHHWLQILSAAEVAAGATYSDPNAPNAGAVLYNITNVNDPALWGHHLEISTTVIEP
jgi:hypothetical protein